jgi:hypothetical protein
MKEIPLQSKDKVILACLIAVIVIAISIYRILGFSNFRSPDTTITMFTLLLIGFAIFSSYSLKFVRSLSFQGFASNQHHFFMITIKKTVIIAHYLLLTLLALIIIQIVFNSKYDILILEAVIWLSYLISCVLLIFLTIRLVAWLRLRHDKIIFLYSIAIGILVLNIIFSPSYISYDLQNVPREVTFLKQSGMPFGGGANFFYNPFLVTSILSYLTMWFASIILLSNYSTKIGRLKYLVICILPLVYFVSQFQVQFLEIFDEYRISDPILFNIVYTSLFSLSKPVGGILFGFAFWMIARSVDNKLVKFYMNMTGYGILLIFVANQPQGLTLAPYPPFELIAISSLPLASFFILGGIYTSALIISQDNNLRRSVRRSIELHTDLLDKIGSSELELEIQKRVAKFENIILEEQRYIDDPLSDAEVRTYVQDVINEVRGKKDL